MKSITFKEQPRGLFAPQHHPSRLQLQSEPEIGVLYAAYAAKIKSHVSHYKYGSVGLEIIYSDTDPRSTEEWNPS